MKLIIDIEKDYYEMLKYNVEHGQEYKPFEIIANGIPYNPTVELTETEVQEVLNKRCMTAVANEYLITLHSNRPQGEWIPCTKSGMPLTEQGRLSGEKWYGFKCSNPECNYIYKGNALTESPFCQKCGADMRKGGAKPTKEVIDKLGECKCNTCKNNGTWVCVNKCRCFDKYVGGAE